MSNKPYYDIEGRNVPRVSTILNHCQDKTNIILWQKREGKEQAEKIRNAAAELGKRIHKALELRRTDETRYSEFTSTFSVQELGMLSNYDDFNKIFDAAYVEKRLHYFNKVTLQEYAGTPDAMGVIETDL